MRARPGGEAALAAAAKAAGMQVDALVQIVDKGRAPVPPGARAWVLDPVDGTKGFLRGAQFCTALALVADADGGRDAVCGVLGCPNLSEACGGRVGI